MTTPSKEIDRARTGVGKGLMSATGGWGCEREAYYKETVRDAEGRRLSLPMPERVHFGAAIDSAHSELVSTVREVKLGHLEPARVDWRERVAAAHLEGMKRARAGRWDAWPVEAAAEAVGDATSWEVFSLQLRTALEKLVGILPNHPKGEDSVPGIPPLMWLGDEHELLFQGLEGTSLRVEGQVAGEALTGTPDYVREVAGVYTEWVDVKAVSRAYSYPLKWVAAESVLYDYLLTVVNGGVPPDRHTYLEYRRNVKPYWALTTAPVNAAASVGVARGLMRRWELALAHGDVDTLSFSPNTCGECPFREAMPEVGHGGCSLGQAVAEVTGTAAAEE